MKAKMRLFGILTLGIVYFSSCGTTKLAQNNIADDVYNTTASAKVFDYNPPVAVQSQSKTADSSYRASDYQYDMDYSSRIDRFYYGSPYRSYFDDYYNFYGYDTWYDPFYRPLGLSFTWGWGWNNWRWHYSPWFNPYYSSWYYYGAPYHWNTWGPYSYYRPWYGGYYGGYWGGGYWGGNVIVRNNENYRPRPDRNTENRIGSRPNGAVIDRNTRGNTTTSRNPGVYVPSTQGGNSNSNGRVQDSRPARGESTSGSSSRPSRTQTEGSSSRPVYTPPPSNSGNSSSSSSGTSSSSSGSSSRPTRGGGRG